MSKKDIVDEIVKREWEQFQHTQNVGGRASCQDNFPVLYVMRTSQAMAWSEEMAASWLADLKHADAIDRNLVTEKYARMMRFTVPEEYAAFESQLPKLEKGVEELARELTDMSVKWAEETAKKYPHVCGRGRSLHSSEDTPWNTSLESYSIGELETYSLATLKLFKTYYDEKLARGENLYEEIEENTAKLMGYESLAKAEESMAARRDLTPN